MTRAKQTIKKFDPIKVVVLRFMSLGCTMVTVGSETLLFMSTPQRSMFVREAVPVDDYLDALSDSWFGLVSGVEGAALLVSGSRSEPEELGSLAPAPTAAAASLAVSGVGGGCRSPKRPLSPGPSPSHSALSPRRSSPAHSPTRHPALLATAHYGTKPGHFETSKIHFPTSEGVSEVSERANE